MPAPASPHPEPPDEHRPLLRAAAFLTLFGWCVAFWGFVAWAVL